MLQKIVLGFIIAVYIAIRYVWWKTDNRSLKVHLNWILKPINLITGIIYAAATFLAIILFFKDYYLFTSLEIMVSIFGLILLIGGAAFACWARLYMGQYWAPANDGHHIAEQSKLHTGGPFKYSRNPIYVGLFIAGVGFFVAVNSYLIITMYLIYWYFNKSIIEEETLLKKHFGESYTSYMKKVPRYLYR